jgi:8-amino-7-oxononanoate synthase (EC 2.3.1.47)
MNFSEKLSDLKQQHLYRSRKVVDGAQSVQTTIDGKSLINFCSNDYLSLANHPLIKEAF